jgi:muramoyltetrapeptide carboxypeptidase
MVIFPPAVRPGDRIRVIAPSGPFEIAAFQKGLEWLTARYEVVIDPGIYERTGFLAGNDARRLTELDAALRDSRCRAVLVARGGHGLLRIVHRADFAALESDPKWLIGFSDATLLHVEASRLGIASIHASNLTGLGRGDEPTRNAFAAHLEAPYRARRLNDLGVWLGGSATGPLFGGNLTLLTASAASGRLYIPEGSILLLEDIAEAPYRVDRMLTALLVAGALDRVAGVAVGEMTSCKPGPDGVPIEAVLEERLTALGVPVLHGLPLGHGDQNVPVTLGITARLDGAERSLTLGQSP